jgi:hypothetical protein
VKSDPRCCSICGSHRTASELAPYFVGDLRRHSCERPACREEARIEIRTGELLESRRAAA